MSVLDILDEIRQKVHRVKVGEAENDLTALIIDLGPAESGNWISEIERAIGEFHPKRRSRLSKVLSSILGKVNDQDELGVGEEAKGMATHGNFDAFQRNLEILSESHLFQWSTHYREWVGEVTDYLLDIPSSTRAELLNRLRNAIAAHTKEVFEKGFRFKVDGQGRAEAAAHATAISGMQRFADLVIENYSGGTIKESQKLRRIALREASSSMLAGIISGFAKCEFDSKRGAQILAASRIRWFHYLTFIDSSGIERVAFEMGDGTISKVLLGFMHPMAFALDKCVTMDSVHSPLPQLSQYFHESRRLEISVAASNVARSGAKAEAFVLLDAEYPAHEALKEAEGRDVALVICSLKPDVARSGTAERMQDRVVDLNEENQSSIQFDQRASAILSEIFTRRSRVGSDAVLEHNFASSFPLNNPFQSRYFHVVRKSVRNLLQEIEVRNGVRLWCSARRSGKTTACNDLSGALVASETVVQTCEIIEDKVKGLLYGRLVEHLDDGIPIKRSFLSDILDEVRLGLATAARVVLVIDEYETLFGRLQGAVSYDSNLKYTVVFPFLDQLVEFSKDNVIVLVGQQPNAHFVFMDQNKLSAYVTQDSFPLFAHNPGSTSGEFVELLTKVASERFGFTASFADILYGETRGHPFLTVNTMVSIVEWLIESRVKVADIKFDRALLCKYFDSELSSEKISLNTQYQFFLEASADAMGENGRISNPWLWAVYRAMRMFVDEFGPRNACSIDEFTAAYKRAGIDKSGVAPLDLLRTGDDSNFFDVDAQRSVRVGIPLLARIAASATPRMS